MQARRTLFCLRDKEQGRLRIVYSAARTQEPLCLLKQGSGTECGYGDTGTYVDTPDDAQFGSAGVGAARRASVPRDRGDGPGCAGAGDLPAAVRLLRRGCRCALLQC